MSRRCEVPVNTHWCGQEIPVYRDENIFQFLTDRRGQDIIKVRDDAMFKFDLTTDEFNYWLGEWRFTRR